MHRQLCTVTLPARALPVLSQCTAHIARTARTSGYCPYRRDVLPSYHMYRMLLPVLPP